MHRLYKCSLFLLLAACRGEAPAVEKTDNLPDGRVPSVLIQSLDSAALTHLETRKGEWAEADAHSAWRAFVSGTHVRLIEEFQSVGDNSARHLMHYFTSDGHYAALVETRDQLAFASDRPPVRELVTLTLEFTGDSATRIMKTVDGLDRPVESFEIESARKHGLVLLASANTSATSAATERKQ